MSNIKKLLGLLAVCLMTLAFSGTADAATWISGSVYKMPGVPQNIGVADKPYLQYTPTECRSCHLAPGDTTTANMHHVTPTALANGCLYCHPADSSTGTISVGENFDRTCTRCHAESRHHKSPRALGGDCAFCHNSSIIAAKDNPRENTYYTPSISTPSTDSCNNCHLEFNPDFQTNKIKPNRKSHHLASKECGFCHNDDMPTPIRQCQKCHTMSSLHSIEGHVASQKVCLGCHEQGVMSEIPTPNLPPSITTLSQVYGETGHNISIFGENFGDGGLNPSSNHVWLVTRDYVGGNVYDPDTEARVYEARWTSWYGDQINFIVPDIPARVNYSVYVETALGRSNARIFTTLDIPSITSVFPYQGVPGDVINIDGASFSTGGLKVYLTQGATSIKLEPELLSDTQLQVTLPGDIGAGPYDITVVTSAGTSNAVRYTVLTGPYISNLEPNLGRAGSSFTIVGTGLDNDDPIVTLDRGDIDYTLYPTVYTATSIKVDLPYDIRPGNYQVTVANLGGVSSAAIFTVLTEVPTLTNLSQTSGKPGTVLSVYGSGFVNDSLYVAFLQGTSRYTVTPRLVSNSQLEVAIPNIPVGSYEITASTTGGSSNKLTFELLPGVPVISGLSSSSGLPGSNFSIYGEYFTEPGLIAEMRQGETTISLSAQYVSTNELQVSSPADIAPGNYDVTVTTAEGISNSVQYSVSALPPTISSITPDINKAGADYTINGTGFVPGTTVTMTMGTTTYNLTPVLENSTQLQVSTPPAAAAGTYSVVVQSPSGTSAAGKYTIGATPRITNLNPTTGKGGTTLTISGQYLDLGYTKPIVYFDSVQATVLSYTTTSIVCQVPNGLKPNRSYNVTVNNGYATSSGKKFQVRP